jgi:hypothetical protein
MFKTEKPYIDYSRQLCEAVRPRVMESLGQWANVEGREFEHLKNE